MADPDLDRLLRLVGEADAEADPARNCPGVTLLWLHQTRGDPLGQQEDHVDACPRCHRRLAIIREEVRDLATSDRRPADSSSGSTRSASPLAC